jgi:uncharacterized protein
LRKTGKLRIKVGVDCVKATTLELARVLKQHSGHDSSWVKFHWKELRSAGESMEPANQSSATERRAARNAGGQVDPEGSRTGAIHDIYWVLIGDHGLRAGWSALIFVGLYYALLPVLDTIAASVYPELARDIFSPIQVLIGEFLPFVAILAAGVFMARVEHRTLRDYNLRDSRRLSHFAGGLAAGFAAVSVLVAAMTLGGWVRFAGVALSGTQALKFGIIWAGAFLLVGLCEEGSFRCYLQSTLARGINFWWAMATVAALCLLLQLKSAPQGSWGVYLFALVGLIPCWLLHRGNVDGSGFWQAAWATSTAFGYYHTGNHGENWIGVFAASLIGFVFCVSVRVTGSAWWAIGCHAAWDWAETYLYGTADSGFTARGHYLATTSAGNPLWSGGTDGPEGSVLALPVTLLLLGLLLFVYGRKQQGGEQAATVVEPLAG